MFARLIVGILKGLVVGGLVGFALIKLGVGLFVGGWAVLAYIAAAVTGIVVGLIAGKPIWAKDAKVEAGMKAFVGALLGAGLMFGLRKIAPPLADSVPAAFGVMTKDPQTLATFPITALAWSPRFLVVSTKPTIRPMLDHRQKLGNRKRVLQVKRTRNNVLRRRLPMKTLGDEEDESLSNSDKKAKK
jgi:hypothetical protein